MPRYKIIIQDPDVARNKEVERNVKARVARDVAAKQGKGARVKLPDSDLAHLTRTHRRDCEQKFKRRPVGTVHDIATSECPHGRCRDCGFILHNFTDGEACDKCLSANTERRLNCRNCGDPQHATSCAAQGHCPDCGTRHGIASAATLAANGYALVAVTPEEEAEMMAAAQDRDA